MWYQNINGATIEFGTQNDDKAYSPFAYITFLKSHKNDTVIGWKRFPIMIGKYSGRPFQISMDVKRNLKSADGSFLAVDNIRLINCASGTKIPRKIEIFKQ